MWRILIALKQHPSRTLSKGSILPSKYSGILKEQENYRAYDNKIVFMGKKDNLLLRNATKLRGEHSEMLAALSIRTMNWKKHLIS